MPFTSFNKSAQSHFRKFANLKASTGLSSALRWEAMRLAAKLGFPGPELWKLHPRATAYPLYPRLRGSSDMMVFDQIFFFEEYSCLKDIDEPRIVIDLGANVGFSAAYFLNAFPKSKVIAVEPDELNVEMCRKNLSPYGERVLILHGAAWSRTTKLRLLKGVFGDGLEWATQVGEIDEGEVAIGSVQAWDVGSLIDMSGGSTVDLLKIDIEKGELSVFGESATQWLHRVRNICIELHGEDCEKVFFAALKDFDYKLSRSGELTICRNLRPLRNHPRSN